MDKASHHHLRQDDRKQLDALLVAVNGAMKALRRDECGDYTITGSRGTIRACDGKYFVYIPSGSARAWTFAKRALASLATPSQDGDEEGILTFDRMPNADEAETLRSYIGLRQTRPPDHAQNFHKRPQKPRCGPSMRQNDPGCRLTPGHDAKRASEAGTAPARAKRHRATQRRSPNQKPAEMAAAAVSSVFAVSAKNAFSIAAPIDVRTSPAATAATGPETTIVGTVDHHAPMIPNAES
jgi:hypothetical protein